MKFDFDRFEDWLKSYTDYEALKAEAKYVFSEWTVRDPALMARKAKKFTSFINKITDIVEKFARDVDDLSGKEKQKGVKEFIDSLIELNDFMEWADNIVIDWAISVAVETKNEYLGEEWFLNEQNN